MGDPEAIPTIKLVEAGSMTQLMRNLVEGWGFVMLSNSGLIQVLRIKAYMEGTIRLLGIC